MIIKMTKKMMILTAMLDRPLEPVRINTRWMIFIIIIIHRTSWHDFHDDDDDDYDDDNDDDDVKEDDDADGNARPVVGTSKDQHQVNIMMIMTTRMVTYTTMTMMMMMKVTSLVFRQRQIYKDSGGWRRCKWAFNLQIVIFIHSWLIKRILDPGSSLVQLLMLIKIQTSNRLSGNKDNKYEKLNFHMVWVFCQLEIRLK